MVLADHGLGDLLTSHELEDIVNVIASRTRVLADIEADIRTPAVIG